MLLTKRKVDRLIRACVNETMNGMIDWIREETDIVYQDTKEVVPNTELSIRQNAKRMVDYVWPRLEKHGIIFTRKD